MKPEASSPSSPPPSSPQEEKKEKEKGGSKECSRTGELRRVDKNGEIEETLIDNVNERRRPRSMSSIERGYAETKL